MKRILYLLLVCVAAISCQKETGMTSTDAISINTTLISRATELAFDKGDKIGIWFLNGGADFTTGEGNYKDNTVWENTEQGWKSSEEITYPSAKATLDYYAYYPYDAAATTLSDASNYSFTVKTDQTSHQNYSQSDFLYASDKSLTARSLDMRFNHKMSRITLDIKLGSEMMGQWPEITAVKIGNVATQTTINLATGAVSGSPALMGEVTAEMDKALDTDGVTIKSVKTQAVVVPQQVAAGSDFLIIETPEKTYKHKIKDPIELSSSSSTHFNVTLREGVIVINSVEITDWISGWEHNANMTRAVAYDFTTFTNDILDFSFTNLYRCFDEDMMVVGVLSKEYIQPLGGEYIVIYPITDIAMTTFPNDGYIVSTGQKVTFTKADNITTCKVGAVPEGFRGVYRTIEGSFIFTPDGFTLTDPATVPYIIEDTREATTLGHIDDERGKETYQYGVVKIGSQLWFKQNLKTSKLSGGYPLRIGKIGLTPTNVPQSATWAGWFGRSLPGCIIYGDEKEGAYLPSNSKRKDGKLPVLIQRREKYGMLYNYHAVNAQNETSVNLPEADKMLPTPTLTIPTNSDWYNLIKYLKPGIRTSQIEVQTPEVFSGLMELMQKSGFVTSYSGYMYYVSSNNPAQNYIDLDVGISFWSSDVAVVDDTKPENNTAWVWCSKGTPVPPATTNPDFSVEPRFIREAHSVRLMANLPMN